MLTSQSSYPSGGGSAKGFLVVASNGIGCLISALLLVGSALTWLVLAFTFWAIEALILSGLAAAIAVITVGLWFGANRRVSAGIRFGVGNSGVLVGFSANLVGPALDGSTTQVIGILIYVGGLLMLFGYAVLAGTLARLLLRALARLR